MNQIKFFFFEHVKKNIFIKTANKTAKAEQKKNRINQFFIIHQT